MSKLGRKKNNRQSLIRNLVTSLLLYEKIDTTREKAKCVKSEIEKIITRAKSENSAQKRYVSSFMFDKNAVKKLYNELLPRYKNRKSGFVRSVKIGFKNGDGSAITRLELIDKKVFVDLADKSKSKEKIKS